MITNLDGGDYEIFHKDRLVSVCNISELSEKDTLPKEFGERRHKSYEPSGPVVERQDVCDILAFFHQFVILNPGGSGGV